MKKIILLVVAAFVASFVAVSASAQEPFQLRKPGAQAEFAMKDASGVVMAYAKTTIDEVDFADDENFSVTQTVETFNADRTRITDPVTVTVEIKDGRLTLSPLSGMPGLESVDIQGEVPTLPSDLSVGQVMDYSFSVAVQGMSMFVKGSNTVLARESVTTPAGTFECYKVEGNMSLNMMMVIKMRSVEWYARGIGAVKTQTFDETGKLTFTNELISLTL